MVRAVVFDVDGTLAETEEIHRQSFNHAFRDEGLDWEWDRPLYAELLATTGGRERILAHAHAMGETVDAEAIHARKTRIYTERIKKGSVALRPGVAALIDHARRSGLVLAIGTTTSRPNVVALLAATLGPGSESLFRSIRTGEDVRTKKPDPEVYRLVLQDLDLSGAECLCIEDSRNGLLAARATGMRTVITPSIYSTGEDFTGADLIIPDLSHLKASSEQWPNSSLIDRPMASRA
ncbi:Protein cbbY [Pseudorhizobium banfieldiae]|uniref:Protein cbbY n=1 Tax=Pseudorhizobium banfieldiae TaxID=1125847 RepID=L0NBX9_9HYPH|nr:HAD-IA family hydrolase [Pseudorhizobium banfieldiae]CAD6602199.1 HAD-superfamily hydrolase [arsenite-oxidising bacterium NT-25]CCF18389.1 Protein cbbY [Pseudorhizobium banfieldiae]